MEIKKIYFDMDGVLADFDRGVQEICGLPCQAQDAVDEETEWQMWNAIREAGHFYDKLQIAPGAKEMFDAVYEKYGDRCEILTGIPKPHRGITTAGEDKTRWMHRLLAEDIVVNIVYKEQKKHFCTGPDCVLIDDFGENIDSWRAFGGTGILHRDAQSSMEEMRALGIL
ncbi:MAG: hypothetical protein IJ600_00990 [Lachnospiraceae bacterium]|nr:hypothetical protein [Lachnospiraceae bacterium]